MTLRIKAGGATRTRTDFFLWDVNDDWTWLKWGLKPDFLFPRGGGKTLEISKNDGPLEEEKEEPKSS